MPKRKGEAACVRQTGKEPTKTLKILDRKPKKGPKKIGIGFPGAEQRSRGKERKRRTWGPTSGTEKTKENKRLLPYGGVPKNGGWNERSSKSGWQQEKKAGTRD